MFLLLYMLYNNCFNFEMLFEIEKELVNVLVFIVFFKIVFIDF